MTKEEMLKATKSDLEYYKTMYENYRELSYPEKVKEYNSKYFAIYNLLKRFEEE